MTELHKNAQRHHDMQLINNAPSNNTSIRVLPSLIIAKLLKEQVQSGVKKYLWSIDLHFIFDKWMWQTSSMRYNNQDTHQGVHCQYDAYFRALQHGSSDQWKKFL